MNRFLQCLIVFLLLSSFNCFSKQVYVRGYVRKNGTVVKAHFRSSPGSKGRSAISNYAVKKTYVNGYYRKDWTYVHGHYRALPGHKGQTDSYCQLSQRSSNDTDRKNEMTSESTRRVQEVENVRREVKSQALKAELNTLAHRIYCVSNDDKAEFAHIQALAHEMIDALSSMK